MVKAVKYQQFSDEEVRVDDSKGNQMSNTPTGPPPKYIPTSPTSRTNTTSNSHIELKRFESLTSNGEDDEDDELSWYLENFEANSVNPKSLLQRIKEQVLIIIHLGAPNCIEKFSSFFPGFMLLVFYGRIGPDEISGAGFGFMFGNGIYCYIAFCHVCKISLTIN
jgi:hypothetical protein